MKTFLRSIPAAPCIARTLATIASATFATVYVEPVTPSALAQGAAPCATLAGHSIEPPLIGIPSGPALITSATTEHLPAAPAAAEPSVAYCKVLGEIAPLDAAAPPIRFEVNLPEQWNGKAVQYGGSGFNGVLITGLDPLRDARLDTPVPVTRGFATWGTDSGHQGNPVNPAFAVNAEALENYAFASYKKVRDAAVALARAHYGTSPRRIYYYGGSAGGREGLTMAQRFPADFDGIVSTVPAINFTGLQLAVLRDGIALMGDGWLSPTKVRTLHNAVLEACDASDGLVDGIVSRYAACRAAFDPKKLRCPDRRDNDNCLSDAQIAAIETIHSPYAFPFSIANGITSYPGYNYGGEDQPGGMVAYMTGLKAPAFPLPPTEQGISWRLGSGFVRYFIASDPNLDPRKFRAEDYRTRIEHISALMDSTDPDLSRYAARGGKLILKENMSDYAISPFNGIAYYNSVVEKLGQTSVDSFMRFYVTTGANHLGAGVSSVDGAALPQGVDLLEAIDGWVDRSTAPGPLVQVAQDSKPPFAVTASHPLCRYPQWPRYVGSPPDDAASFSCVTDSD
jgi:Tannase and feruloyl esterase